MFVFPAFDDNYKTRKRSFRCCQNCRVKKVKCEINSTGCVLCSNCRKHNWKCDLNKPDEFSNENHTATERISLNNKNLESRHRGKSTEKINDSIQYRRESGNVVNITPQYLKQKYNFNISGSRRKHLYQYLCHGHPKAVMDNKTEDQSVWHESGVYIDEMSRSSITGNSGTSCKGKLFKSEFHIRNQKIFNILLAIDAFTLSTSEYPFSSLEIRELLELYFFKINSLFPIVEEMNFWTEFDANEAPTIIVYAIILIILRDKLAEPIIKHVFARNHNLIDKAYTDSDFSDDLIKFITDLEYKIRQVTFILPQLGDIDKITLLVELLLLSCHYNFNTLGNEQSSHDITDAINLAVSSGIHMKRPHNKNTSQEEIEYTTNLWWCCYIFDRFNGLTNSRCIFIKQEDFNVDLPYNNINLLKLVQLARSLENMTIAIYQPFDNNNTPNNNNTQERDKLFNVDEFQRLEFEFCEKEKLNGNQIFEMQSLQNGTKFNTKSSIEAYKSTYTHFLTRLVNNTVILFSQKAKYDNNQIPNSIPEAIALEASKNILRYVLQIRDEVILNIPIIPWCIAVGMAVLLKKKAKYLLKASNEDSNEDDCEYDLQNYISILNQFSKKWWVVDEICKLSKEFVEKISKSSTLNKRHTKDVGSQSKRAKIEMSSNGNTNHSSGSSYSQSHNSFDTANRTLKNIQRGDPITPIISRPNPIPSIVNMLNENKEENNSTPDEYSNLEANDGNYIENKSMPNSTTFGRQVSTPNFSDQYHDFLESMHIDLFDNDFLKDFSNIVNQLMEGE